MRLKLNDNKVFHLPDWIGKFTKLQHLSVGNNRLEFIPYPLTFLNLSIFTVDGNPLTAVETGVLMDGPKEVIEFLTYNHNYDLPDRNLIPDPMEQRRQMDAHIKSYTHEIRCAWCISVPGLVGFVCALPRLPARNVRHASMVLQGGLPG